MSITWANLKAQLAMAMGDALTTGTPVYTQGSGYKWSEYEYDGAIRFSLELIKRMYLLPVQTAITWTGGISIYEFTPPSDIIYVTDITRETSAGSGQYEVPIPLHSVKYERSMLHFDKTWIDNNNLNSSGASVLIGGYRYQPMPSLTGSPAQYDGSLIDINYSSVMQMSKLYLHQGGATRDPSEIVKNMRQFEQAREVLAQFDDTPFPESGGIWLDI
jgi:hypothetical protein